MKKDKIKGGKTDKLSIKDVADKHNISLKKIEIELEIGIKIEMEHTDSEVIAREIALDHLFEFPDYYSRLTKMEKRAEKELTLETKKFMALAGIKEFDKKFLKNESFSEREGSETTNLSEKESDDDSFITHEFEQSEVEPGEDDEKNYKIKSRLE